MAILDLWAVVDVMTCFMNAHVMNDCDLGNVILMSNGASQSRCSLRRRSATAQCVRYEVLPNKLILLQSFGQ